uniref:Peptidylprolyl isomerase n=1 Tax=Oryza nivara TaxID=4536 RepID=A0A0E0IG34_ORYNI
MHSGLHKLAELSSGCLHCTGCNIRVRTLQEYTGQLAEEEASAAEEESPIESFPLPRKIRDLFLR